ncbi:mannose-1-phosphate guanylyltransferase [Cetobacterium ceti]|uniref:mannose-1-phosphate guanylyltransferase n=1 Tax=Cetobacterium ceti TaxID=180163 RepID=A0A1T4M113_9FUSO|nr:sugar phosphate nucleotidyltransferase [Cetobacterium ceti]SJZ60689.1 mannose-1-phosphate guanylyltransferase [Cetobacterium ceti]
MKVVLIMAGGSGERFWPLSTREKPKQLLKIFSEKSMIRETVDRVLPIVPKENIFISTNILQWEGIHRELEEIPVDNIIIEPMGRDTASAIGYGAIVIDERFKGCSIELIVLPADHMIKKEASFREVLLKGCQEAKENSVIVTLGIKPTRPETGYGYIEVKKVKDREELKEGNIYRVKRFREKPNQEVAETYVNSGNYLWNSGMFIFSMETIFKNFQVLMEDHWDILKDLREVVKGEVTGEKLSNLAKPYFEKFEKISIDYGIMEQSKNIRVIPCDIGWSDLGSYNAFSEIYTPDSNGNITKGRVVAFESKENIVIGSDFTISLLGVDNLVVVKGENNNILIAKRSRVQDIKKLLDLYRSML